jgi:DNA-directed RNA polymerase specialized sigma24 family protein
MESYEGIKKQLNGLIMGIKECNFIPLEEKKDIIQNTWVKIIEKMNEGVLKDDATDVRGYVFQILRNNCLAYHNLKKKSQTSELKYDPIEDTDDDLEEYKKTLKNIVKQKIQAGKYNQTCKKFVKYVFEEHNHDDVFDQLGLPLQELRRIKQSIVIRLKADLKREVKYLIKNNKYPSISIPCYKRNDVKDFFPDYSVKRIGYLLNNGYITPEGFYVENFVKNKSTK